MISACDLHAFLSASLELMQTLAQRQDVTALPAGLPPERYEVILAAIGRGEHTWPWGLLPGAPGARKPSQRRLRDAQRVLALPQWAEFSSFPPGP